MILRELPKAKAEARRLPDKSGYETPLGLLDSVTRILGATSEGKENLQQWLKRPDAEQISKAACNRGTWTHNQIEKWIEDPTHDPKHFAFGGYWRNIKPFLEEHHVHTVAQEKTVYHPAGFAGSFDNLGYWSYTQREDITSEEAANMLTLLDWKTSKNYRGDKRFKDDKGPLLQDYFCQLGAYAAALNYVYGVKPERALLVIARPTGQWPDIWELTGEELEEESSKFIYRSNNYYIVEKGYEP
jgi:hypothetical protein